MLDGPLGAANPLLRCFFPEGTEAFVEAAAELLVADDPARLVIIERLLDGSDETGLRDQAIERFR